MAEVEKGEEERIVPTHDQYTKVYVDILEQYKELINASVSNKNHLKENFFAVMIIIIVLTLVVFSCCLFYALGVFDRMILLRSDAVAPVTGAIVSVISSFVTMLLAIIKLPKIIARYLFNKKEDKLMNEIIKNIQKYEIKAVYVDRSSILEALVNNDNNINNPSENTSCEPESKSPNADDDNKKA